MIEAKCLFKLSTFLDQVIYCTLCYLYMQCAFNALTCLQSTRKLQWSIWIHTRFSVMICRVQFSMQLLFFHVLACICFSVIIIISLDEDRSTASVAAILFCLLLFSSCGSVLVYLIRSVFRSLVFLFLFYPLFDPQ